MKTYMVGGAVRDKLLGRKPRDCDFIVTETQHDLLLKSGFIPVGKDHAVYLHPETKEEYTLAENLEDDLGRRDLTINAMALEGEKLLDPFGGERDIQKKLLKHVKEENFFNDPLRVYRVARLNSELPEFKIDSSTWKLLEKVVKERSFCLITPERVLLETTKALSSERPSVFFEKLKQLNALSAHFKELISLSDTEWKYTLSLLDKLRPLDNPPASYGALFIHTYESAPGVLSDRLLVPGAWKKAATIIQQHFLQLQQEHSPRNLVEMFYQSDAFRNPSIVTILSDLLKVVGQNEKSKILITSFDLTKSISVGDISSNATGKEIGDAIKQERIKRLESFRR